MLVMTATPIPRTLVLTYFGDMDISELREKPAGRKPVDTRTIPLERYEEVVEGRQPRARGRTPRLLGVPAGRGIRERRPGRRAGSFRRLQAFGRASTSCTAASRAPTRMRAMARFAAGETRLLVATTVIEVGVDVPAATVMVIEHAERFGLAQLHQLRGRIGRGATALDLPPALPGAARRDRPGAARGHARDRGRLPHRRGGLALRGEGDVLGTRQSGLPGFRIAQPAVHRELLPRRATTPRWCWRAIPTSRASAARRCARCSTCSSATRPCG